MAQDDPLATGVFALMDMGPDSGLRWSKSEPRIVVKKRATLDAAACVVCGKAVWVAPPSYVKRFGHPKYCSPFCRNTSRRKPRLACVVCGGLRQERSGLTCSAKCGYEYRKTRTRKAKACPVCSASFFPKLRRGGVWSKYCSARCNNVKKAERLAMVWVQCAECFRKFRRTKGAVKRVKRVFCNKVCFHKFNRGENVHSWRGGHDPNRGPGWLKLAAEIRKRDDHTCRRCGRTQAENGQKLDVDHIVPWRLFPGHPEIANSPENLVALCRKCHRHKTAKLEQAYLKGDCCGMSDYEHSISLPPLFEHYRGVGR